MYHERKGEIQGNTSWIEKISMKWVIVLFLFSTSAFAVFKNESEFARVQTGGNSQVMTTNLKTTMSNKWELNQLTYGGHYIYGESGEKVSARNWDVNGRFEHQLTDHLSLSTGEVIEGNRFNGVKARYNSDAGAKYYYTRTDAKNIFTELAYRYTIEDRYAPAINAYDNKMRIYNEINHKISETVQYRFWLEFVPNFTDRKDYLINSEASLTSILNSVFSLKVAYLGMYDNKPAQSGFKNYDYNTTTSLVIKY